MTRVITESFADSLAFSYNFIDKLIQQCPDNLWTEIAGKWPIWQHVLHGAATLDAFLPGGEPIPVPEGLTPDVLHFKTVGTSQVSKTVMLDYFKACRSKAEANVAALTDADLVKENPVIKAMMGQSWTYTKTLVIISSHLLYHLGAADVVLRNNGLEGIF